MDPHLHYIIHLADNALILGHRNSEWTGHGPILEQDIALSNIALDLIGQARNFYQLAASRLNAFTRKDRGAGTGYAPGKKNYLQKMIWPICGMRRNSKIPSWWNNPMATGQKPFSVNFISVSFNYCSIGELAEQQRAHAGSHQ